MTTRHPTARRVHHDHTGADDAFIARMIELTAWAKANTRALVAAGAVVVLAATAGMYYRNNRVAAREQSAIALLEVRQTVASGNSALAIRDLEAFITRFGGTAAADEARLLLAQVHLGANQPQKAAEAVADLAAKPTGMTEASAAFLLAATHEAAGELDQAEATYLRIADSAELPFQRREALDHAARIRLERGNAAGSAELYQRLVDMTQETAPERAVYQLRLAEAKAAQAATN